MTVDTLQLRLAIHCLSEPSVRIGYEQKFPYELRTPKKQYFEHIKRTISLAVLDPILIKYTDFLTVWWNEVVGGDDQADKVAGLGRGGHGLKSYH